VCRQDGGKFITKGDDQKRKHNYPKTSVWETMMFKRKRQLWKPQPNSIHKRKTEDRQLLEMLEGCKPRIETQLSEHILRYRLHRLKHPNFEEKAPSHSIHLELLSAASCPNPNPDAIPSMSLIGLIKLIKQPIKIVERRIFLDAHEHMVSLALSLSLSLSLSSFPSLRCW